jgi:hypothetical protein
MNFKVGDHVRIRTDILCTPHATPYKGKTGVVSSGLVNHPRLTEMAHYVVMDDDSFMVIAIPYALEKIDPETGDWEVLRAEVGWSPVHVKKNIITKIKELVHS